MARNNVKIVITVDDKGTPVVKQFAAGSKKSMDQVGANVTKNAASMRAAWLAAAAALAAVTLGMRKLVQISKEAIEAANTQARAVIGMETVFKSMSRTAPGLSEEMQALASSLQRVTNYGDEATIEGVKFLGTYKDITDDLLPRTVKAMLDLAAATGRDTVQAANMLGKASMGMTGELRRVGITVDKETYNLKGYAGVLELIEQQFGGQAEAMRTAEGSYTALGNEVVEIKERFGELLKVRLGDTFENWAQKINQFNEGIAKQIEIVKEEMAGVREEIVWMGEATTTMLTISGAAIKALEREPIEETVYIDPEKFAEAYAAAEKAKDKLIARIRYEEATRKRTEEEQRRIQFKSDETAFVWESEAEKAKIRTDALVAEEAAYREHYEALKQIRMQDVIDAKEAAEAKLREEIRIMNAEAAEEKAQLERDKQRTKQWLESSMAMAAQHSKTAWRAYQAYRISEAIVDTIEAAQASYRWGSSWGGPIGGAAMAAIATAAGMMRVQAIAAEKPSADEGGIYSGPRSGYDVELHGTEAIVPLPGGRGIPIEGGAGLGMNINLTIVATDARSFAELTESNPDAIVGPVVAALQAGHRGLTSTIRDTTAYE